MKRKRGELVPIGDALGPVKAIRDDSPQAWHSFTVADQVDLLVSAREAAADLGFMARTMALCSLPRSNPGDSKAQNRRRQERLIGTLLGKLLGEGRNLFSKSNQ